jgi:hypothetical protein
MSGLFEALWMLVSIVLVVFVVYVLWQMLQALQGISRNIEDVAKALRQRKSE